MKRWPLLLLIVLAGVGAAPGIAAGRVRVPRLADRFGLLRSRATTPHAAAAKAPAGWYGQPTSIEPSAPPAVPTGGNASGIAFNATTHTLYVVNQSDDTVSVINADACHAHHLSGCGHPLATITLGAVNPAGGPVSAILSPDGGTLYVTSPDGANALAVVDAATCNAIRIDGCSAGAVATVATGQTPLGLAEDPLTDTVYVTNSSDNDVSIINGRACNAQHPAGCSATPPTAPAGQAPLAIAIDPSTHTVYIADLDADTVSVIDTLTCNAQHSGGCASTPPAQAVGGAPGGIAVAPDGSVYVANTGLNFEGAFVGGGNTVSVFSASACNGAHPAGCTSTPAPAIAAGGIGGTDPQSIAFDPRTDSVYVPDDNDDTIAVIDAARCNIHRLAGCAQRAPTEQAGAGPSDVAVDPPARTVYVGEATDDAVSVISDGRCTAAHPFGCRPAPAPATMLEPGPGALVNAAVDQVDHTVYTIDYGVDEAGNPVVDMFDANACNAQHQGRCNTHETLTPSSGPNDLAVDTSTDTLYLAEGGPGPGGLEVIAARSCNATVDSCARNATIPLGIGSNPAGPVVIDQSSDTADVGEAQNDAIAVIDTRHCNSTDMSGCADQPVATIPFALAVSSLATAPDTLYAMADSATDLESAGYVDVFDTRHCRAADTSRCASQTAAVVTVGSDPTSVTFDAAHRTLYVPDNADGDGPGELSMIDTSQCNGENMSGCAGQIPPTVPMRRSPFLSSLDPSADTLYVTNFSNASVSLIDTDRCNANTLAGCPRVPPILAVGSGPWNPAVDPATHTVYVPDFWDGTVSLAPAGP